MLNKQHGAYQSISNVLATVKYKVLEKKNESPTIVQYKFDKQHESKNDDSASTAFHPTIFPRLGRNKFRLEDPNNTTYFSSAMSDAMGGNAETGGGLVPANESDFYPKDIWIRLHRKRI